MTRADEDLLAVRQVRDAFVAADNANDHVALGSLLTDDVVILHPHCGIFSGRDAVLAFMRDVLTKVAAQYDKRARYSTIEVNVASDFAYERGELAQELRPRAGGPAEYDRGEYLWIFRKGGDGTWRIARIAGAFQTATEADTC